MSGTLALVAVLLVVVAPGVNAEREDEGHVAQVTEYFINIGTAAEDDLVRRVRAVQNDSTVESVEKTLGKPDVDKKLVDKRGACVVRRLYYYSKKASKSLVNEKEDRYLALDFDAMDRLIARWEKLGAHKRRPL